MATLRSVSRINATLSRTFNSWIRREFNSSRSSFFPTRSVAAFTVGTQHADEPVSTNAPSMNAQSNSFQTETSLLNKSTSGEENFEALFENSHFARVLNPIGKRFQGEVIAVVGENLYVDFGCKFHAVVKLPEEERESYRIGTAVVVLVKSLELTDHFLGQSKHISLLEAEAELIGLLNET